MSLDVKCIVDTTTLHGFFEGFDASNDDPTRDVAMGLSCCRSKAKRPWGNLGHKNTALSLVQIYMYIYMYICIICIICICTCTYIHIYIHTQYTCMMFLQQYTHHQLFHWGSVYGYPGYMFNCKPCFDVRLCLAAEAHSSKNIRNDST